MKYDTIIQRVKDKTMATMKKKFVDTAEATVKWPGSRSVAIKTDESGYFQGFSEKKLLTIARERNLHISFLYKEATYLNKGIEFMMVHSNEKIDDDCRQDILSSMDFFKGQPIDRNADYGFYQLAEVAIKALSPGINDPATAVLSLHALSDLFSYRLYHQLPAMLKDENDEPRIWVVSSSFRELFEKCIHPIWSYGEKDAYIQTELILMMEQLRSADKKKLYHEIFEGLEKKIKKRQDDC